MRVVLCSFLVCGRRRKASGTPLILSTENFLFGKEILANLNVIPVSDFMYFPGLVFQY